MAEDPARLLGVVEEQRTVAEGLLPQLRFIYSRSTVKPRVRLYEGLEGIRTVLYDTLKCRSKKLLGILSMRANLLDVPGREETDEYIRQRIREGISLRVLRSREKDVGDLWPSGAAALRELRYTPPGLVFTMTTWIYDEKVAVVARRNFGMTIESEEFARCRKTCSPSCGPRASPSAIQRGRLGVATAVDTRSRMSFATADRRG